MANNGRRISADAIDRMSSCLAPAPCGPFIIYSRLSRDDNARERKGMRTSVVLFASRKVVDLASSLVGDLWSVFLSFSFSLLFLFFLLSFLSTMSAFSGMASRFLFLSFFSFFSLCVSSSPSAFEVKVVVDLHRVLAKTNASMLTSVDIDICSIKVKDRDRGIENMRREEREEREEERERGEER